MKKKIAIMLTLILAAGTFTACTAEEKVKKLEKQLSAFEGEEKLAIQLREKEEFIKQLKGTRRYKYHPA